MSLAQQVIGFSMLFGPGLLLAAVTQVGYRICARTAGAIWDRRRRRARARTALAEGRSWRQLDRDLDQHWQHLTRKEQL
ncbi:hypothetical protein [Streptomyces sp. NRRL F-5135]|uniref:hypothetical protein n=1 Tax=Streptomyces sp. NRRL F-5135 TaxID=1463858 RepID=UPI000A471570|nr:hypothetical protein [Streptomyces sp. NRRL F-5135]